MDTRETTSAVVVLAVGVGVMVLTMVLVGALGGTTYELNEGNLNEIGADTYSGTFTANNRTNVSIGHTLVHTDLTIVNATGLDMLANFSVNYTAGTAWLHLNNATHNNTVMTVAYTYDTSASGAEVRDNAKDGIISSFKALSKTGSMLPLIVLAIVITLVLTLVLGFAWTTAGGNKGGSSGAL